MIFTENKFKNETYIFKYMLSQTDKSDSILAILEYMEDNETCNHLTFTKIVKLTRNIGTSKVISRLFYLFNTLSNRGSLMAV